MSGPDANALEALLKRDRLVVVAALGTVIVASWLYILAGAGMGMSAFEMSRMSAPASDSDMAAAGMGSAAPAMAEKAMGGMAMALAPMAWTPGYALLMVVMWWVMMLAMMLPSATPMILLFALFNRRQREQGRPYVPTAVFAAGYGLVWCGFSIAATGVQWGLERVGLVSSMMVGTSVLLGAGLLIAAGIYQLTPLKYACLEHCRSPLQFISHRWRPGRAGALRMGIEHGAFCVGCCWFLMALLFYGGVMNLYWIIGLAVFVLVEKLIPAGHWLGRITGVLLIAWGGAMVFVGA